MINIKKYKPIYNVEPQINNKNINKTIQFNLYKIKLKFFIVYNQNNHINISRFIFEIYLALNLEIEQLDIKTTFLFSNINKKIYIK